MEDATGTRRRQQFSLNDFYGKSGGHREALRLQKALLGVFGFRVEGAKQAGEGDWGRLGQYGALARAWQRWGFRWCV